MIRGRRLPSCVAQPLCGWAVSSQIGAPTRALRLPVAAPMLPAPIDNSLPLQPVLQSPTYSIPSLRLRRCAALLTSTLLKTSSDSASASIAGSVRSTPSMVTAASAATSTSCTGSSAKISLICVGLGARAMVRKRLEQRGVASLRT